MPWTPLSEAGLVAWYDASVFGSFTLGGGNAVNGWADQSGNGYDVTNYFTAQGTYTTGVAQNGDPGIVFSASNNSQLGTTGVVTQFTGLSTLTYCCVGQYTSNSAGNFGGLAAPSQSPPTGVNSGNFCNFNENVAGSLGVDYLYNLYGAVPLTQNVQHTIVCAYNGSTMQFYFDGVAQSPFSVPAIVFLTNSTLFPASGSPDSVLLECFFTTNVFGSTDVANFQSYAQSKWFSSGGGLTINANITVELTQP